jgi:hypothetical protein
MLTQIQERLSGKETFAVETTLAIRSCLNLIKQAQLLGYKMVLCFVSAFDGNGQGYSFGLAKKDITFRQRLSNDGI